METFGWILASLLFLLAYVGVFLPVLPDAPLALAGFVVYHFLVDSESLGWGFWITAVLVTGLLVLVDLLSGAAMARKYGGSRGSIVAAVIGALVFPAFMGPIGVVVGPFLLVFLLEWVLRKDAREAVRIGFGTLIGFLGGVFVKFVAITGLIVWFLLSVI
ncbi:DUF456 domain-containing protein [Staphylospora marina]|uniref:DUF456 domain-containing protein n=1 Tax=Staphylospora marina TaxID=2490858 RepID=UPI0013DDAD48|nr:DUF456 domain-containing protein [Staphylospora marina]